LRHYELIYTQVLPELHELVTKTGLPSFVTPMGKGAINESLPNYGGVYSGDASQTQVKEWVESTDLLLSIGGIKSDFNTGGFTFSISQLSTVEFHSNRVKVKYSEYPGVRMKGVLRRVIDELDLSKIAKADHPTGPTNEIEAVDEVKDSNQIITQAYIWPRIGQWLRKGDVVVTETGTSNFGILDTKFPDDVIGISQVLWGSIGYSVGALQGASLAASELEGGTYGANRRVVLFVGDGSLQLTCQEISTMIRLGLKPIIFCICNQGYTIERLIHGMDASYNDIQPWHQKELLPTFGAKEGEYKTYQVKTKAEIHDLFKDETFSKADKIQFVELYMDKYDAPKSLKLVAERSAENNSKNE
jgi:pyruvate decarboxylase